MKTVKVDFSRGLRGGLLRASQRRASEPLRLGDRVEAIDPAEDMEFTGTVERLDDEGRFGDYLRMDWEDAERPRTFALAKIMLARIFDTDVIAQAEPEVLLSRFAEAAPAEGATSKRVLISFDATEAGLHPDFIGAEDEWEDDGLPATCIPLCRRDDCTA